MGGGREFRGGGGREFSSEPSAERGREKSVGVWFMAVGLKAAEENLLRERGTFRVRRSRTRVRGFR